MAKNKFNIGLIGAGEFGNFASFVIEMLEGFNLYAVVDTNEESAMKLAKKYGSKVFTDYLEMLNDEEVDIVIINVPNDLHAKISQDAVKSGKRVLCEKPLGINIKELNDVRETLEKEGGILLVNYLIPRSKIYEELRKAIKDGRYGELKFAHIENLATESTIDSGWYWDDAKSGGWFLTADIHFYDLLLDLLGDEVDLIDAKEYKNGAHTNAIYTSLSVPGGRADIFHDFSAGYKRARCRVNFVFSDADVDVLGWIPEKMVIRDGEKESVVREEQDREIVYQKLVAENIKQLAEMSHEESLRHLDRVIKSSKIAFKAREKSA